MSSADAAFTGSIPALYDRHLGPLLFEPYAEDLAERVRLEPARSVLEIAAGTGIVTRALRDALPSEVRIVASDLNAAMLDYAAQRITRGDVTWRQADAMSLPFADHEFDVVVCQFGAMFFPDRVRAFREARRVLAPGGRFVLNLWAAIEFNPVPDTVERAVAAAFPGDPPRFLSRTPYGHGDPAVTQAELREAGFSTVAVAVVERSGHAASAFDAAFGFCQGSPLGGEIEARNAGRLDEVTRAAAEAIAARYGDGPFDAPTRAYVYVARKCVRP